jgi:deoxyribodipyrimidine photo-lyase
VLFWFRRDLRLRNQTGLSAAIARAHEQGGSVVPVFALDPTLLQSSGANRKAFLFDALRSLAADGVPLVVRDGNPETVLIDLAKEFNANSIVSAHDFGVYGRKRDANVLTSAQQHGLDYLRVGSPYAVDPGTVRKLDGTPFKVFTPFKRVWETFAKELGPTDDVDAAMANWATKRAEAIPANPTDVAPSRIVASESQAHIRLERFLLSALMNYDEQRNIPSVEGTARISADLKYGLLHPRQILPSLLHVPVADGVSASVFRSELGWREFYADVLWHQPHTARSSYAPSMAKMRYDTDTHAKQRFAAWCEGNTGYPFIDAGMRQLLAEGWMHNRVRMAVASFLVKDLHVDWRWGAKWFMQHLIDGDLASNQHGWQWTAGTGTDASPYYRVFNPISQGKKFDPNGEYVRRFVPELRAVATKFVHEPWLDPTNAASGLSPKSKQADLFSTATAGDDAHGTRAIYPAPIVDHAEERAEALRRYAEIRESAGRVEE